MRYIGYVAGNVEITVSDTSIRNLNKRYICDN